MTLLTPNAQAVTANNLIENGGHVQFGVIHLWNNPGNYDVALKPGGRTDQWWRETEGFYLAPNYCANVYRRVDPYGGEWSFVGQKVRGRYQLSRSYSYWISSWYCGGV